MQVLWTVKVELINLAVKTNFVDIDLSLPVEGQAGVRKKGTVSY